MCHKNYKNIADLTKALMKAWDELTSDEIRKICATAPNRGCRSKQRRIYRIIISVFFSQYIYDYFLLKKNLNYFNINGKISLFVSGHIIPVTLYFILFQI